MRPRPRHGVRRGLAALLRGAVVCSLALPAAGQEMSGVWSDGAVTFVLEDSGGSVSGSVRTDDGEHALSTAHRGPGIAGSIGGGVEGVPFAATLEGDVLIVHAGGAVYRLRRQDAPPEAEGAPPPAAAGTEVDLAPAGRVLAQGAGGSLTQAAAVAYHEALLFCLAQLGVAGAETQLPREAVIGAVAQAFPSLPLETQQALAAAPTTWSRVRTGWDRMPLAERQAFARDVIELAFGSQGGGGLGSTGGGGGDALGLSIDGSYPGQDCWASAGCLGYDEPTGSYEYEGSTGGFE